MTKKTYYVNVDSMKVTETSIPSGIEYEVIANGNEVQQIEILFMKLDDDSQAALKFVVRPLNEKKVDGLREDYDKHLINLYSIIYKLGTDDTKLNIEEMGILK